MYIAIGIIIGLVVLFGGFKLVQALVHADEQHQAWLKQHCRIVAQTSDSGSYGWYNGKYVYMDTPGTTTYKCDDGITRTEQN